MLGMLHIPCDDKWPVEENLFTFGGAYLVGIPVLLSVSGIPLKAFGLSE